MDTLNALVIELNAELDEVRRAVRKLTCERRMEDIPGEMGLLRAIVWGILRHEELYEHDTVAQRFAIKTLEAIEDLINNKDHIIERTYKALRKTLRLTQYLNERPF